MEDHFMAVLVSLPKTFPITHRHRLITQASITLNLLCPYFNNLTKSVFEAYCGAFWVDSTPIALTEPNQWSSWGVHAEPKFYIGPTLQYYQCYKVIMQKTGAEQISNSISFQHHFPLP